MSKKSLSVEHLEALKKMSQPSSEHHKIQTGTRAGKGLGHVHFSLVYWHCLSRAWTLQREIHKTLRKEEFWGICKTKNRLKVEGGDSLSCRARNQGHWWSWANRETVQRQPRLKPMLLQKLLAPAKQECEPTPLPWPSWPLWSVLCSRRIILPLSPLQTSEVRPCSATPSTIIFLLSL